MRDIELPDAPLESDHALIQRTAVGDRDAFATLYRRHQGSIYRFARLMTGCPSAAEDVVQEVFLVLMKDAARYDPARAALTTYLYGIARRVTRRRLMRERRFVAMDLSGAESRWGTTPDASAALEQHDALAQLRGAILSLPSRYREVVILCEMEGVTYETAAESLGCAIGTIRSRLHRARQLLATKLRRAGGRHRLARVVMRCAV
jgi:RNA polymerase sigma-70 factor (ECF subfamily)